MKKLYSITRPKAGAKKIPDRPVRAKSGELLTDQKEQRKRWANRFRELLNRPLPSEIPNKEPAETRWEVDESRPSKEEVKRTIRHLKIGMAASPDAYHQKPSSQTWKPRLRCYTTCLVKSGKQMRYQMTGKKTT